MSKIDKQVSQLTGELVAIEDVEVPFAPGFNLEALRNVDDNPQFATVKVKAGKGNGGKGPNYGPAILKDLERQFNEKRPSGYKGHQDPSKVDYEWREPVTAWVGAQYKEDEQALYVKGYVPPTAPELRAQLALAESGADVINSVSIWGMRDVQGEEVTAFDLWSLDWTPKGRNGMEAELVKVSGEQQDKEDDDVNRDEVIASLTADDVPDPLKAQLRGEMQTENKRLTDFVGEMKVLLELDSDDPDAVVDAVRGLVEADQRKGLESRVSDAVEEEISGELMRTAIKERLTTSLPVDASDDDIAGEIAKAKDLPHIKALAGSKVPVVAGGGGGDDTKSDRKGTSWQ